MPHDVVGFDDLCQNQFFDGFTLLECTETNFGPNFHYLVFLEHFFEDLVFKDPPKVLTILV